MPTFEFELPQEDFEYLKEVGTELGMSPSEALSFFLKANQAEQEEINEAMSRVTGLPTFHSREDLLAKIDEALDDPRPRIEATPAYFAELRRRCEEKVANRQ